MPISTPEIDIYADYPTIEPSLRLDFANSRALDPRITFTRASVATYVGKDGLIKYAKENEPRFDHDPATGESLGLLIEEQRTNLYVNNHDPALGASGTATKTTVQIVLPSGETGPALETDASGFAQNYRNQTAGSNTAPGYLTFYAKKKTSGSTGTLTITLEGGSTGRSFANIGINSDTWTKITHTHDWSLSNSTLRRFDAYLPTANTSDSDTSFYLAFIQFEDGNFPTSYIPTSGAQATREKEFPVIETSSIDFNDFSQGGEGTLICEFSNAGSAGSDVAACFSGDTHNGATFVGLGTNSNRNAFNRNRVNTTNNVLSTDINFTTTGFYKVGFGIGQSKCTLAVKGSSSGVLEDTSVSYDSTPYTKLILGCDQTSSSINNMINGTIKSVFYYPTLLTNSQLQSAIGIPTEAPPPPPPPIQGQAEYTTAGSYTWTAPTGVTSVCVVCVGGGSASGGALAYRNNITVVPGTGYSVVVGAGGVASGAGGSSSTDGGDSSFSDGTNTTIAGGGKGQATAGGAPSGTYDGGGSGGDNGAWGTFGGTYNGAGAGGYSGDGGNSLVGGTSSQAGSGGGGSSGSWAYESGGGVGIYGEGTSGAAVTSSQGQGGSGGQDGQGQGIQNANSVTGGAYGGGFSSRWSGNQGGGGAVRIIWGSGRAFPSTNTADV